MKVDLPPLQSQKQWAQDDKEENKEKGACEQLGYNVFDCTSRKQMESCNDTSKAIVTHVGKSNEHDKQTDSLKCLVEKEKKPEKELKEPEDIKSKDIDNPIKMCKWQEKHKRHSNEIEEHNGGKKDCMLHCGAVHRNHEEMW